MPKSPTRKPRLGFIGAGWWATTNHMPVLQKRRDVEFASVCRLGADELQQVKERFGFRHATQDYRELLDSGVDAVIVTSPHTLHYEHAIAALRRGLPVMVEKPLTTNAAHARELVAEARKHGVPLLVPYGWHYKPFVQEAKRRMDAGAVGNIEFVLCHMASPIRRMLRGQRLEAIPGGQAGGTLFEPDLRTWADPEIAGGGYGLGALGIEGVPGRLAVGAALALALGAAKEGLDAAGYGTPSWRDFAWDVTGTAFGLMFSFSIDYAARPARHAPAR